MPFGSSAEAGGVGATLSEPVGGGGDIEAAPGGTVAGARGQPRPIGAMTPGGALVEDAPGGAIAGTAGPPDTTGAFGTAPDPGGTAEDGAVVAPVPAAGRSQRDAAPPASAETAKIKAPMSNLLRTLICFRSSAATGSGRTSAASCAMASEYACCGGCIREA